MSAIVPLTMPKWGLSMQEGIVQVWHIAEGQRIAEGAELAEVETSKITNVFEAPFAGLVRRIVVPAGETAPVGALLAVLAEDGVPDAEIDAFIADFAARFTPEAAEEAASVVERRVEIGEGRTLRASLAGPPGTPIVFLHGFGGDLKGWAAVQPALAVARATIALDLPGHGGSTKEVGDATPEALAKDVLAALDALEVNTADVVGHSLGAAVGLALGLAAPARVRSLALVCPAALPGTTLNAAYLDGFLNASRARDLAGVLATLFAERNLATREMAEEVLKTKRLDGAAAALAGIRDRMAAPGFSALGARVFELSAPLLVLASREDRIVGAPDPASLPPHARLEWLDGLGHMPQIEAPDRVVDALRRFMP